MPSYAINYNPGCDHGVAKAVSFGIDTNFLVAILVCVAILLILLLAVVVHRRKTDDLYKDMDDIRENIINYEDEGGGEVDTGYDLNVLRAMYDAPPIDSKMAPVGLEGRGKKLPRVLIRQELNPEFTNWLISYKFNQLQILPTKYPTFAAS